MAIPLTCPISQRLPYLVNCKHCPNFNYLDQVCEHDDIRNQPVQVIERVRVLRPEDQYRINHLEKRLNEHIDKSRKKVKDDSF